MNDIQIKDNFLNQKDFTELQRQLTEPAEFPWFLAKSGGFKSGYQFTHQFYHNNVPTETIMVVAPIVQKLMPASLWKITANLRTLGCNIESTLSSDMVFLPEYKLKYWTTSIFHVSENVNTTGHIEFENGTKVESIANRMLTFPTKIKYRNISNAGVFINLNYFKIDKTNRLQEMQRYGHNEKEY